MTRSLYIEYWQIGNDEYWKKVQFFEDKANEISFLEEVDSWEIELDYLDALFRIGKYKKLLSIIDIYIEKALDLSRKKFIELLEKKASSHWNNNESDQAEILAEQILAINPLNTTAKSLLLYCIRRHKSPNYQLIRAGCNFLFLLTSCAVVVHWLLILPFYPGLHMISMSLIKASITFAIISLLLNEFLYRMRGINKWKRKISEISKKETVREKKKIL